MSRTRALPRVREHLDKLRGLSGDREANHWRAEERAWLRQVEGVAGAVGEITAAGWRAVIAERPAELEGADE